MTRRKFLLHSTLGLAARPIALADFAAPSAGLQGGDRIRPWKENPYYWEYKGRPVLMLGGSDEDNLFNNPPLMKRNLKALEKCGGNYIRCTLSSRDKGNRWPFLKTADLFDLV
jgi:hypothetical protein